MGAPYPVITRSNPRCEAALEKLITKYCSEGLDPQTARRFVEFGQKPTDVQSLAVLEKLYAPIEGKGSNPVWWSGYWLTSDNKQVGQLSREAQRQELRRLVDERHGFTDGDVYFTATGFKEEMTSLFESCPTPEEKQLLQSWRTAHSELFTQFFFGRRNEWKLYYICNKDGEEHLDFLKLEKSIFYKTEFPMLIELCDKEDGCTALQLEVVCPKNNCNWVKEKFLGHEICEDNSKCSGLTFINAATAESVHE